METEYDYLFKIVLIGDAGVGKTSIVRRYTDGIFTSAGIPTIGVDFCIKTLQIGSSAVKVGGLMAKRNSLDHGPIIRVCNKHYQVEMRVVLPPSLVMGMAVAYSASTTITGLFRV